MFHRSAAFADLACPCAAIQLEEFQIHATT